MNRIADPVPPGPQHALAAVLAVQAHGFLPDEVALNDGIGAEALLLLSLRTTLVNYTLGVDGLNLAVSGGGLSRDVVKRANAEAKRLGYLQRSQPTTFSYAREKLTLPKADKHNSQIVWRSWFRGVLTRNELASLLFMRARGKAVRRSELAARFGWSLPTATAALQGLMSNKVVIGRRGRHGVHFYRVIPQIPKNLDDLAEQAGAKNRVRVDVKNPARGGVKNRVHIRTPSGTPNPDQILPSVESEANAQSSNESQLRGARAKKTLLEARELKSLRRELEHVDGARALAPGLLTPSGLQTYARMLSEPWATNLHDVVREKLTGYMLDGFPEGKAVGFIDGWGYFEPAAKDRAKADWLAVQGLRPGDVHGARQKPLTAEREVKEPVMPPDAPPHETIPTGPQSTWEPNVDAIVDVEVTRCE